MLFYEIFFWIIKIKKEQINSKKFKTEKKL